MPNHLYDDEFNISKYLHDKSNTISDDSEAEKWSSETGRCIITATPDLLDLEDQWIRFNGMIKKHRRESDWKSIELYGLTNQERYEKFRNELLGTDIENYDSMIGKEVPLSESYIDMSDSYYETEGISYTSSDVDSAREWAKESDRVIILPTRTLQELEDLWTAFNCMIKKHCRESDWKSLELFGATNLRHYEYLKNQFLKEDMSKEDKDAYGSVIESVTVSKYKQYFSEALKESIPDTAKSLLEMLMPNNGIYDDVIASNIVSDVLDKYDSDIIAPSDAAEYISCCDMPYLNPDEMIDMGVFSSNPEDNFFGVLADNFMLNDTISVKEWFNLYRSADESLYTEFVNYTSDWVNKVRTLMHELNILENNGTESEILSKKQSIIELGWDPSIEFSNRARILAREVAINRMRRNYSESLYKVIDLSGFRSVTKPTIMNESVSNLKPVYVIAIEGKSYFSKAIRTVTKDIYSHVAISLDPTLHNMYSYGIAINKNSDRAGFRREDIDDLPIGGRIAVFTFFLGPKAYSKICNFIDTFKDNAENTSYSYINLLTYLFNIPYNMEWKLTCTQFVDRCLKSAGIDLVGKDSSQISPSDFNKSMTSCKKIYKVYEGLHSNYNFTNIQNLITPLLSKGVVLKESQHYYMDESRFLTGIIGNIYDINALKEMSQHTDIVKNKISRRIIESLISESVIISPIGEAKEFPIQFDKEGNLLIKNLKKLDYEAEYAKSHKLLKSYAKSKNYVGIKYELSKMWMMLCLIEDTMRSKKFQDLPSMAIASSAEAKAKAKLANDFQYYLAMIMKEEKNFNFTEYYESSPFSSAVTKINSGTLKFMAGIIKQIVKHI